MARDGSVMAGVAQCFQFDDVEVRPAAFEVLKAGRVLPLEPKAIRVLVYLIENRDRAVTKDELLREVWEAAAVTDNALTRIVAQLRRELGDDARQPRYIQTIPTLGYRFVAGLLPGNGPAPSVPVRPTPQFRPMVLLLAVIGLTGLALWALRQNPAARVQTGGMVQLTTSPGLDIGVSFSPDGRSIAYSSDRSGRFEVYIRGTAPDARERQITQDGGQNMQPVWSPDGKSIAFYSVVRNGICTVPAAGGPPRQLTVFGSSPAWSPDSARIAFRSTGLTSVAIRDSAGSGSPTIWEISAAGGAPRQLTHKGTPKGGHLFPAWMPDGRRVAFVTGSEKDAEIHSVDTESGAVRRLWASAESVFLTPVFSPDGSYLYYTAYSPEREFGIWRIKLDGAGERSGVPEQVASTGASMPRSPSLSGDGKRLAFTYSATTSELWSIPVTGGTPEPVFREAVSRTIHPSFSPDGSRLAFVSRRFGSRADLWVMNADGSAAEPVSTEPDLEFLPSWSSDSQWLFYTIQRLSGTSETWKYEMKSRRRDKIWTDTKELNWSRVGNSGSEIVYHIGDPPNIWRKELPSGASKQLTFDREGASYPSVSRDGQWIAYELTRGEHMHLVITNREGRVQREWLNEPGQAWAHDWAPDNRRVAYAGFDKGSWNIYTADRVTGERRKLTDITSMDTYVRYPAWSPKDDRIVFELGKTRGNVYLLELR